MGGVERFIPRAHPTTIRPSRRATPQRHEQLTIAAGDAQIPFHDSTATRLFLTAVRELQPDNVVLVGDMLDLPSLSRFEQRPEWQQTTQAALDTYHDLLAVTRANAPNARLVAVHGNHEQRLIKYAQRNAAELLGIRRANAAHELAVLTIPYLARYDELEVECIDGYPNGTFWLEDNLKFTHGTNTQRGGSNAAKYLREERYSTVYGHSHRMEVAYRTHATRLGHVTVAAASPGALCRTDGTVPGFNHTVSSEGVVIPKAEDWQQGLLVIAHQGNQHDISPVRIDEGMTIYGKRYE